jgi:hypothetical protein
MSEANRLVDAGAPAVPSAVVQQLQFGLST